MKIALIFAILVLVLLHSTDLKAAETYQELQDIFNKEFVSWFKKSRVATDEDDKVITPMLPAPKLISLGSACKGRKLAVLDITEIRAADGSEPLLSWVGSGGSYYVFLE